MGNEKKIEKRLKDEVSKIGGIAMKLVSPGMSGVPDRLVLLPDGNVIFVEVKDFKKRPRALQLKRKKQIEELGSRVEVIDSVEGVMKFVEEVKRMNSGEVKR